MSEILFSNRLLHNVYQNDRALKVFRNRNYFNCFYTLLHIYTVEIINKQKIDCKHFVHNKNNIVDTCNDMFRRLF